MSIISSTESNPQWLTTVEVCSLLRVGEWTVKQLRKKGALPYERFNGGGCRYRAVDVEKLQKQRTGT